MKRSLLGFLMSLCACIICNIYSFRSGYKKGVLSVETKIERDTTWKRYDSLIYIKEPMLVWAEPTKKPQTIDTAKIIEDYYQRKVYADGFQVDSFLYVSILDSVENNAIIGRKINYSLNIPTVSIRQKKPNLTVSIIGDSRYYAGTQIGWKRVLFSAGYDFKDKFPVIGVGLKLYER